MSKQLLRTGSSRRHFLKLGIAGLAAIPLGQLAVQRFSWAQDLPMLEESDPTAQSLGYQHHSTQVDGTKYPQHTDQQFCHNCQLYTGKEGEQSGPCSIFPGKAVSANGWCSAWVAKAS